MTLGRLTGKVALITGAASGIGLATAELFAAEGAQVILVDVDGIALDAALTSITSMGHRSVAIIADVTQSESVAALEARVRESFGRLDVLFNNAGVSGVGTLHETTEATWDHVFAVNVRGVYLVSRALIPLMLERGSGSIINMSSAVALIGVAERASYTASKGAVLALTRAMQVDYAKSGLRVNALLPGTILTPFVERYIQSSSTDRDEAIAALKRRQLSDELGRPEDVARAALFLASDESRFVMGSAFVVDGGMTAGK